MVFLFAIACVIVPESPREFLSLLGFETFAHSRKALLIKRGRIEDAKKHYRRLIGNVKDFDFDHEFAVMVQEVELSKRLTEAQSQSEWRAVFKWQNFRRILIPVLPYAGQSLTGGKFSSPGYALSEPCFRNLHQLLYFVFLLPGRTQERFPRHRHHLALGRLWSFDRHVCIRSYRPTTAHGLGNRWLYDIQPADRRTGFHPDRLGCGCWAHYHRFYVDLYKFHLLWGYRWALTLPATGSLD